PGREIQRSPRATTVRALEDAGLDCCCEDGVRVLGVDDERRDRSALQAGRRPPPAVGDLSADPASALGGTGAAAAVEEGEAEQAGRERRERQGRVPAPPPPCPASGFLDQRLER